MKTLRLAVLIDADNVPYAQVSEMLQEIAKYGTPTTKRIYGDWTRLPDKGWKSVLLEHAITPIQQYSYTTGKNATDAALIIDAMDILYSGKVDGFCIVSSDSDFTKLATRLRESGMLVIGIGERKTPNPFIVACDRFIYLEMLDYPKKPKTSKIPNESKRKDEKVTTVKIDEATLKMIEATVDDLSDDDGWAFLGDVGNLIVRKKPDFDPRNYGFLKLTPLLKSLRDLFEIDERELDGKKIKHVYIRLKN